MRLKPLGEQVLAITGGSSGIGLATAKAAAAKGAKVVLVARTGEALHAAADEIVRDGGEVLTVGADVASREALQRAAEAAVARFGRIDTWVNNAGVGILGPVEAVDEADMRRLFETNFWGQVHGSLVALPYLEREGGALINMGSIGSDVGLPLQAIYAASKHAVKGFTDSLRMELEARQAPVSVTLIKPGAIDTPMPQHMKNYTGREAKFPPPIYAPEDVAAAILHAAAHPERDLFVGSSAWTGSTAGKLAPRLADKVGEALLARNPQASGPAPGADNLDAPGHSEARIHGDRPSRRPRPSLYTRARLNPVLAGGALLAGVAIAGLGRMAGGRR